ncbi:MAG: 2-oxoglutarate dehydrogenase complex dihydrolipoyllysine-residue succinyltransferase [Hydrogenophilales bacterium]|nr:2-oxoglutarate dehydrogenase complex dihydrolipoyllysine-residue succinyltransferase [Hydrogenophilales bacterium]
MLIEVKSPEFSESVQSGTLLEWRKQPGDMVKRDETLADIETDKVVLEIPAPVSGRLAEIRIPAGTDVRAGDILAMVEADANAEIAVGAVTAHVPTPPAAKPVTAPIAAQAPTPVAPAPVAALPAAAPVASTAQEHLPPSARKHDPKPAEPATASAQPVAAATQSAAAKPGEAAACPPCPPAGERVRSTRHVPMSRLRLRIAERMVEAQHNAAILTTFNEIDMLPVQELRSRYQEKFQKEHGVKLGFMSFFVKATTQALKQYPVVNASVDGRDILYHDYYDIGVAVSSERGLVVPILRDTDTMSFADVEKRIVDFGKRANSLDLTMDELTGGTFTISNGGVFGSLMSTPILNPPQSGVMGLHKIQDRPIAANGQVVIRPMMYIALSYDHRIVDGKEAVSFLRYVKDALEDPARLLLEL